MKNKVSKVISKLVMAAVGILFIAQPTSALGSLIRFLGIAIALIGVFGVISFVAAPYKGVMATIFLVISVIALLLSIIPIAKPELIIAIFPLIIGITIAINGVVNTIEALALKGVTGIWLVPTCMAILAVILGCVIAFYPFKTMDFLVRFVGVILVYSAVVGLFTAINTKPNVRADGVIDITNSN